MVMEIIAVAYLSSDLKVGDCFVWKNPKTVKDQPLSYHYSEDNERKVVLRRAGSEIEYGSYDWNSHGGWSVIARPDNLGKEVTLVSCKDKRP